MSPPPASSTVFIGGIPRRTVGDIGGMARGPGGGGMGLAAGAGGATGAADGPGGGGGGPPGVGVAAFVAGGAGLAN